MPRRGTAFSAVFERRLEQKRDDRCALAGAFGALRARVGSRYNRAMKHAAFLLLALAACANKPAGPAVAAIASDRADGCGCLFLGENNAPLYWHEAGTDVAWMNIDGVDVELKRVTEAPRQPTVVGSRAHEDFAAGGLRVGVDLVVTRVCAPDDEACESFDVDASIAVQRESQSTRVAARGSCGC